MAMQRPFLISIDGKKEKKNVMIKNKMAATFVVVV
jgi:hypothetical protein